jgi:hypothetical protein
MLGFLTGLLLGAGHAVSGPDHLAAVAPLATGGRAWRVGLSWGAGHAGGVVVVALALALLGTALELETLGRVGEQIVGISLIGVGAWMLLRRPRRASASTHAAAPAAAVGLVHGVAGGSHLYAALPAVALADGLAYLGGFALGAVLTMGVFAGVLGRVVIALGPERRRPLERALAGLTLLVGVVWLALG